MTIRISLWVLMGLLLTLGPAATQAQYRQRSSPPRQAIIPQNPPILQRRAPRAPGAPFVLTPQQQARVDAVLKAWEEHSNQVKRFECDFTRFEYDGVFGDRNVPTHVDQGKIKYAAPDKGMFQVIGELAGGRLVNGTLVGAQLVKGQRAEHWICDGKSVFEYDFQKKQLIEHQLPPELQGKAIADGPLPFLFGAKAEKLKARYFIRLVTPQNAQGQVWLEAWPRFQRQAADFKKAEMILSTSDMQPFALRLHQPTGQSRTVFQFTDIKVNSNDLLGFLKGNPFKATTPLGWKKIVEEAPPPQVGRR